jgi:hypothetical protein|tara:strand:- start:318 stop:467 length:150 start_codon:yes stop_codon:yes gene_type:complete
MTITKQENKTLNKHKVHHTKKHMRTMRFLMKKGMSFTKAHKKAMKEVGK